VARQCVEALREAVLLIATNDTVSEVSTAVVYGVAGSIVKSSKEKFSLENDEASPGSNKVYGTNSDGERVWKDDPDFSGAGAITELPEGLMSIVLSDGRYRLDGDAASPGNNKFYGTDASGSKCFKDLFRGSDPSAPVEVGRAGIEGTEAALSTTYLAASATTGLKLWVQVGSSFFEAGDKKLYAYLRPLTWPAWCAPSVGSEIRVEVDTPQPQ
jgi:hypothetical protein